MKFSKERKMYHYNKEKLAKKLGGKTEKEVLRILIDNEVVYLKPYAAPNYPKYYRILYIVIVAVFLPFCAIKWIITGHYAIDKLAEKYSFFRYVLKVGRAVSP